MSDKFINPIQFLNQQTIDAMKKYIIETVNENESSVYTEAVFNNGRSTLEPLVQCFKNVQDELHMLMREQDKTFKKKKKKMFDGEKFFKNKCFKSLENEIQRVFGVRSVVIGPVPDRYNSRDKDFETKIMNAYTYILDRYPIDGLVTDKGFYDSTHSIFMEIFFTLGVLNELTPEELVAVLLHEIGHNVDPALMDISYTQTNILSKYLTDREKELTKAEKKFKQNHPFHAAAPVIILSLAMCVFLPIDIIAAFINLFAHDKIMEMKMKKIQKIVHQDKDLFTRQKYGEAFADNFARMYGFGPQLISGLKKMDHKAQNIVNSRAYYEQQRQRLITYMVCSHVKDVHKTVIHRIHSLMMEYDADIKNPRTPPRVKKQLEDDKKELQKLLDAYQHDFDEFQNNVNRTINEELNKMELEHMEQQSKKIDKKK